jgi:methylthioribose-1-phosphate isomerase
LAACGALIVNYEGDKIDPALSREKVEQLATYLRALLQRGTPAIGVEAAFRMALEIESSEIDAIYSKLIHLGGPQIAKTMENLGVPTSVQRQKLKAALRRYCSNPELLQAAERL